MRVATRGSLVPLLALVLLAGCQTLPRAVPPVDSGTAPEQVFAERQARLSAVGAWTLRGRTAIATGDDGWSGSVHWTQDREAIDLRFIAPLGAGTVRITGTTSAMRLQGSDGTDLVTTDPGRDLRGQLGVEVPVAAMRWWVLGMPDPGAEVADLELDIGGRILRMTQYGWAVSYPRYTERSGELIPGIVVAERDAARVRLIVDRWEPHD